MSGPEVWMINHYAITPDLPGGTRHYDLGCELAKAGYRVRIFASDVNLSLRKHTRLQNGELWREELVDGVTFVWVDAALYRTNNWRRAWNMVTFASNVVRVGLRLRGSKPVAIIGSSPHPFAALSAWGLSLFTKARFVLELRDLWPQALVDMGGLRERSLSVRAMRVLEGFLYKRARKIIVLASGSREYLAKRSVPDHKIAYIPNGVHLENFDRKRDAIECDDMLESQGVKRPFTIVYTGAHGPANALDAVVLAAKLLADNPNIRFVMVGDGPSKADLVRQAAGLGLRNVKFMDPIPKDRIPSLLASADAALITLKRAKAFGYAVSPNKLFDYMAAAKPIICAVPGEMAQLVQGSGAGIAVAPEEPTSLAEAIERLAGMSPDALSAMGKLGRDLVARSYSREVLARQLVSAIIAPNLRSESEAVEVNDR